MGELVVRLLDILALGRLVLDGAGHRALEDVLFAGGEVVEELGGEVEVLGTPIDLRAVKSDLYLVAGMTDHICAWRACYRAFYLLWRVSVIALADGGEGPQTFTERFFYQ